MLCSTALLTGFARAELGRCRVRSAGATSSGKAALKLLWRVEAKPLLQPLLLWGSSARRNPNLTALLARLFLHGDNLGDAPRNGGTGNGSSALAVGGRARGEER